MSENIEKVTDAGATRTVVVAEGEAQLQGTEQSIGDTATPNEPVDQEALDEQVLLSDGVDIPEASGEDVAEQTLQPIANEVQEQTSFWGGFFGKP